MIGLYTGTRHEANLGYAVGRQQPRAVGSISVRGVMYRRGEGEVGQQQAPSAGSDSQIRLAAAPEALAPND